MDVTLFGIDNDSKLEQPSNKFRSILVIPLGRTTEVNPEHLEYLQRPLYQPLVC